ncbi:FkbM family methyltransferase [Sulfolobus tengchongensis]|uniref:FkbM family methyltransferase n=1 Tax=Sulfolobus tengchongensis TaxID=207809 RepID=A0AAX4KXT8_9CREN
MRRIELKPKPPSLKEFLRVKPTNFPDSLFLYSEYLKAYLDFQLFGKLPTIKETYSKLIKVKYNDIYWFVRKENLIHDIWIILLYNEPEVSKWITFKKNMIFVDVGAYIGSYTIRAGKKGANVIAFEPNPISFKILKNNVKENGLEEKVKIYNKAVWETYGKLDFYLNNDMSSISEVRGKKKVSVEAIPLDSLNLNKIDLLKIDVEGVELEVIKGATNTLEITETILIEIREELFSKINKILLNKGFRLVRSDMTYEKIGNYLYEKNR